MYSRHTAKAGIGLLLLLSGCGMPGPPQPPSLKLPKIVEDLEAERSGSQVKLQWTGPTENTDKTKVEALAAAVICRKSTLESDCNRVGSVPNRPGGAMAYVDPLPAELQTGAARVIAYEVATENRKRRSAGWSSGAWVAAGQSGPDAIGLTATNTARGVKLQWQTAAPSVTEAGAEAVVRIYRTRISAKPVEQSGGSQKREFSSQETTDQKLEVAAGADGAVPDVALDTHTEWDQQYAYRVQVVEKVRLETPRGLQRFELPGALSNSAEVETKNVFPPAAPKGLVAVAVWGNDNQPGIDLNWEPNTEANLAGYEVYRVSRMAGRSLARRIVVSGDKLLRAPAFEDRGLEPGTEYQYSVVAVDTRGNVSEESNQVTETTLRSKD